MKSTLMLVCTLFVSCWSIAEPRAAPTAMAQSTWKALEFKSVACRWRDCIHRQQHGTLSLLHNDGKRHIISEHVVGNLTAAMNPRLSLNKRVAGWLQGEHIVREQQFRYFGPTKLVLRHSIKGQRVKTVVIHGQKYFLEDWHFWNNSTQVALLSRQAHGPAVAQLHDARTGKLLQTWPGPRLDEPKAPAWAKKLND